MYFYDMISNLTMQKHNDDPIPEKKWIYTYEVKKIYILLFLVLILLIEKFRPIEFGSSNNDPLNNDVIYGDVKFWRILPREEKSYKKFET